MFCHNCGAKMPDGVKFCTNCGQKLYEEPKTEQPVQSEVQQTSAQPVQGGVQQPQQSQPFYQQPVNSAQYANAQYAAGAYPQGYSAQPAKKKSKAPLAVLLICLIVFIVGGIGFFAYKWVNSPDRKAMQAMAEGDYDTVNFLYDEVTQRTADVIKEDYRSKFEDMERQYESGALDEDEVYEFSVIAAEKVLTDDHSFVQLVDRFELIRNSRNNYIKAEDYFAQEKYSEALECYMKVATEDTYNYNDSLDKIKICNDMMQNDIVGTWVYTIDIRPMAKDFEFWDSPINIDFYVEFDADGTGEFFVSNEAVMDAFREPATALLERELEKQGLPKSYLDVMLKLGGYDDIMDAVKDFAPEENAALINGEDINELFLYSVDGDKLIINGYSRLEFEVDGDYLTILSDPNNVFGFSELNTKPPYTLIRTYG